MAGLTNGIKSMKKLDLKTFIIIFLCISISVLSVSCSNEKSDNALVSAENTSELNATNDTESLIYKGKEVSSLKFIYDDLEIGIDISSTFLEELEKAELSANVPDISFTAISGPAKIIYTDGTEERIGTIHLGKDKALYLKFANNENKDAAFKISDGEIF